MSLPFTGGECRQILELLKTESFTANRVTSSLTHDKLLSKAFSLNLDKKKKKEYLDLG